MPFLQRVILSEASAEGCGNEGSSFEQRANHFGFWVCDYFRGSFARTFRRTRTAQDDGYK